MITLPDYIGLNAFGIKMPVIFPGDNIIEMVYGSLKKCVKDNLLADNSIVCITESVVAKAQNNYVTLNDISKEVATKLSLEDNSTVGVFFPIASRNRFSSILTGISRAVPKGKVCVQFPKGKDEVGNELIDHPSTGMNYIKFYKEIIKQESATPFIIRSDFHKDMFSQNPDGIIVSSIHSRNEDLRIIKKDFKNCLTLQELCNEQQDSRGWSEWGLLGSNLSSNEKLKLAPRNCYEIVREIQQEVKKGLGKNIEVMVYGDGAYKDPSTGIYELADPVVAFGYTSKLETPRRGVKYKFIADKGINQGQTKNQIADIIKKEGAKQHEINSMSSEGTTPRALKDLAGTLADLVSGSADAGTPLVIINGLLN
ncbi:MAG: coenzyme F420-0:L-glutamate ligase [Nanoarchaeota archaeon]|nr:coenzyme F420-0:L-glutamate ligase [Nanoarchaeota archaeon]